MMWIILNELVIVEEFIKQVLEVEGVKVTVRQDIDYLVRPYNYERLPNDAIVNDLKVRMHECLKPFIIIIKIWDNNSYWWKESN